MTRRIRWTEEKVRDWLDKFCDSVELIVYGGTSCKTSVFRCKKCGTEWENKFGVLLRTYTVSHTTTCPGCSYVSEEQVREWLRTHCDRLELIRYGGGVTKTSVFRCKKCGLEKGYKFSYIKRVYLKRHTVNCSGCLRVTEEKARERLFLINPNVELVEYGGGVNKESKFKCKKCGFEWFTTLNKVCDVSDGYGCSNCAGNTRISEKIAKEWLLKYKPSIELVVWGGAGNKKSKFRCKECGKEWETAFCRIKDERDGRVGGCPRCAVNRRVVLQTTAEQQVRDYLKENYPNVELVRYGGSAKIPSTFRCSKCGKEWDRSFCSIKTTKAQIICPDCVSVIEEVNVRDWLSVHKPHVELVEWGGGKDLLSTFRCNNCGDVFDVSYSRLKVAVCCGRCNKRRRMTEEDVKLWLLQNRPDIECLWYVGNTKKLSVFLCKRCGHIWSTKFNKIKSGYGCPKSVVKYIMNGDEFDSSWEIICFLYHKEKGIEIYRNPQSKNEGGLFLVYGCNNERKWYWDFTLGDGTKIEVKPDSGGISSKAKRLTALKKEANERYGYGVVFIGDAEIDVYEKYLKLCGVSWEQYRFRYHSDKVRSHKFLEQRRMWWDKHKDDIVSCGCKNSMIYRLLKESANGKA